MRPSQEGIIFDRDGVLVEQIVTGAGLRPPWTPNEVRLLEGAREALHLLEERGIAWCIATNQPDAARSHVSHGDLVDVNLAVAALLDTHPGRILTCFHDNDDGCYCRKPSPGLLFEGLALLGVNPSACWMVGDRWVDIEAARLAGMRSVLIETEESWAPTSHGSPSRSLTPTLRAASALQAIQAILELPANFV